MPWRAVLSHYLENRLMEWVMTLGLLGCAFVLLIWPQTLERGLFRYMLTLISAECLTILFVAFGLVRTIALILNGKWVKWGPKIRMYCSMGSAMLLGQMIASLISSGSVGGTPSLAIPVFSSLMWGELICVWRASRSYA